MLTAHCVVWLQPSKTAYSLKTNFEINLHLINILHVLWSVVFTGPLFQTLEKGFVATFPACCEACSQQPGVQGWGACCVVGRGGLHRVHTGGGGLSQHPKILLPGNFKGEDNVSVVGATG